MADLTGKISVVTGGGTGIGKATALAMSIFRYFGAPMGMLDWTDGDQRIR